MERFNSAGKFLTKGDIRVIVNGESLVALSSFSGDDKNLKSLEPTLQKISEELYSSQYIKSHQISPTNKQSRLFH